MDRAPRAVDLARVQTALASPGTCPRRMNLSIRPKSVRAVRSRHR